MPGQSTTQLVLGDPNRSLAYVWDIAGGLDGPYVFHGPGGNVAVDWIRLARSSDGYKNHFHGGFILPDDAPVGAYTLDAGTGANYSFTVSAAPASRPMFLAPDRTTAATITAKLALGYDVKLIGRFYEWDEPVVLPTTPCRLIGYGCSVFRRNNGDVNDYRQRMFWGGKQFTLEGVTLYPYDIVFHAGAASGAPGQDDEGDPDEFTGLGFVIKNCKFYDGNFGYIVRGARIEDCEFDRCSCNEAPSGLWLRNKFIGRAPAETWKLIQGSVGTTALIDNNFSDTDRGPCFDVAASVTDNLFLSTAVLTRQCINGCESFVFESSDAGGEFSRNIVFNTRVSGNGVCPMFGAAAADNLFQDLYSDSPGGCILWGEHVQSGNQFFDCEWAGALQMPGALAQGNTFTNCGWRWLGPSRGNQGGTATAYYDVDKCVSATGGGNALVNPRFFIASGLQPTDNVGVTGGKFNGTDMEDETVPEEEP